MPKFVLEPCNDINGERRFFKLIENTQCQWNEFCILIEKEGTWEEQLDLLKTRMDEVSKNKTLPYKKCHKMDSPDNDSYEFKTDNLRVYVLLNDNEYIIVHAGKKSNQAKDIVKYRAIKKRYLNANKNDIERKAT